MDEGLLYHVKNFIFYLLKFRLLILIIIMQSNLFIQIQYKNMETKQKKIQKAFERINPQNTHGLAQSNQIIVMSVFSKISSKKQKILHLVAMTQKFILYYTNHTKTKIKRIIRIDFNCRFQILKNSTHHKLGIKFEREGCKNYDLFWEEGESLDIWQKQLERKINKRGFHEEFKPIKRIGKGNFAAVYLAIRNSDNLKVAVKAFSKEQAYLQQKGKESLINQIKLLRTFNHKNLLKLHAVYESNNSLYLVLEHLDGSSLFQAIQKHHFILSEVKEVMLGLLHGVAQMARKNVIHRDLKPQNIMFRGEEINSDIVILDFGLSTLANEPEYIYTRCGTPGFVAPEIVNMKDLTAKSHPIADIFSLGLILHILLIGRSVFKGKTFNQVLSENRACTFVLKGEQYDKLPKDAYDLLLHMLDINPSTRINAEQCLKHQFFSSLENEELEYTIKAEIKAIGNPNLQDSLGKFVMKKALEPKLSKDANSIQISNHTQIPVAKKSKFRVYKKE